MKQMKSKIIDDLALKLSKYGVIQIIKADYVFTLLLTGVNMSKANVVGEIMHIVSSDVGYYYPSVEALRNDDNFFCLVMKPQKGS